MISNSKSTIQNSKLRIGITGGIGSGKSTVCRIFECLGIPVFSSDDEGRRLLSEDSIVVSEVKKLFGESVMKDGKPDRTKIAEAVFRKSSLLQKLNEIIHPAVRKGFEEWGKLKSSPYIINEAAILFETGSYKQLDKTILVVSPEILRIERTMKRKGMDEKNIRDRIKNQWKDEEKRKLADFVIMNDEKNMLIPQVLSIHNRLTAQG